MAGVPDHLNETRTVSRSAKRQRLESPDRKTINIGKPKPDRSRTSGFGSVDDIHIHPASFRNDIIQAARYQDEPLGLGNSALTPLYERKISRSRDNRARQIRSLASETTEQLDESVQRGKKRPLTRQERDKVWVERQVDRIIALDEESIRLEKVRKSAMLHGSLSNRELVTKMAKRSSSPDLNVRYTLSQDRSDGRERSLLLCALAVDKVDMFETAKALRSSSSIRPAYDTSVVSAPTAGKRANTEDYVHRRPNNAADYKNIPSVRKRHRFHNTLDTRLVSREPTSDDQIATGSLSDSWDTLKDVPSRDGAEREAYSAKDQA